MSSSGMAMVVTVSGVVYPAFLLPTTASPTVQGGSREAVVVTF